MESSGVLNSLQQYHFDCAEKLNFNLGILARFRGKLNISSLRKAVSRVQKKYPILLSFFDQESSEFSPLSKAALQSTPFVAIQKKEDGDYKSLYEEELSKNFPHHEPLFKVIYFAGQELSEIGIIVHHGISDAVVMQRLLSDILMAAEGKDIKSKYTDCSPTSPAHTEYNHPLKPSMKEGSRTGYSYMSLTEQEWDPVVQEAKKNKVSVQGVVSTAIILAINEKMRLNGKNLRELNYFFPINVRHLLGVNKGIGCWIWMHSSLVSFQKQENFRSLSFRLSKEVKEAAATDALEEKIGAIGSLNNVIDFTEQFSPSVPTIGLSNMGTMDIAQPHGIKIEEVYVSVNAHKRLHCPDSAFILLETFNGKAFLNLVYRADLVSEGEAKELSELILKYLRDAPRLMTNTQPRKVQYRSPIRPIPEQV